MWSKFCASGLSLPDFATRFPSFFLFFLRVFCLVFSQLALEEFGVDDLAAVVVRIVADPVGRDRLRRACQRRPHKRATAAAAVAAAVAQGQSETGRKTRCMRGKRGREKKQKKTGSENKATQRNSTVPQTTYRAHEALGDAEAVDEAQRARRHLCGRVRVCV